MYVFAHFHVVLLQQNEYLWVLNQLSDKTGHFYTLSSFKNIFRSSLSCYKHGKSVNCENDQQFNQNSQ